MEETQEALQIMQMSGLPKEQILRGLIKIFNESDIARFTLLIRQTPLKEPEGKQEFSLRVDDAPTTRPKSSTIDRFYRTSHFLNLKKAATTRRDYSHDSLDDEDLPASPKELGEKLYRLGDFSAAAGIFQELQEEFPLENAGEEYKEEYRQILNHLGNCYFRLQQYERAVPVYKQLLRDHVPDASPSQCLRGRLLNNLGCCYGKLGYEKLSMNCYSEALKISGREAGADTSSLLFNIANLYFNCQMFDVCERYYEQAILEREAKNPRGRALLLQAHSKLSLAQIQQRKCAQALANLQKALQLAEGGSEAAELLRQCAFVKELEEKWEDALEFYEQMHALHEKAGRSKGFIFESVAHVYLRLGRMPEHRKYLALALEDYRREGNERKVSELAHSWASLHYR